MIFVPVIAVGLLEKIILNLKFEYTTDATAGTATLFHDMLHLTRPVAQNAKKLQGVTTDNNIFQGST
jgi:hypothetical protein